MLPQWHVKDSGHSAKSAGGRLHLNTHTPLTQRSRSGLTMTLSRHSVETYHETGSHASRQGTLGHSPLSSLRHCGLIPAKESGVTVRDLISIKENKKKQRRQEMNRRTFSPNPRMRGKSHYHQTAFHWVPIQRVGESRFTVSPVYISDFFRQLSRSRSDLCTVVKKSV